MHVLLQMLNKKQKSKLYTNAKQENIVYLKILTNSYNFFILNQCSLQLIYLQQKFVHPIMQKEKKGEIVFRELKSLLVATILNIKNLGSTICSLCSHVCYSISSQLRGNIALDHLSEPPTTNFHSSVLYTNSRFING